MSISVMVATFGSDEWDRRGAALASSLADRQSGHEVFHYHGSGLGQARNHCAKEASGDHLIFVDADDDINDGYCDRMLERVEDGDVLIQPATEYVRDGQVTKARHLIEGRSSILEMNWLVIGTMVNATLFERVGGFDEQLPIYEDWDLWIRCVQAGAKLLQAPEAVYFISQVENSRNNQSKEIQVKYESLIGKRYGRD